MKYILAVLLSCALIAIAQEYKPFPKARITREQWQSYFDQVKSKHQASERQLAEHHLVVFEDPKEMISWAFTTPGHPAHPAWVTRQPAQDSRGVYIKQIGFFAGDEGEFAKLYKGYLAANEAMRHQLPGDGGGK